LIFSHEGEDRKKEEENGKEVVVTISKKACIHGSVRFGEGCQVEDFVIIGAEVAGGAPHPETVIGRNARIRSHTVIYSGNVIGDNFQTGNKANIREKNEIGNDVSIGTLTVVEHHVKIGNGVRVHSQAFIPEHTSIGDGAWIGPQVVITNAKYPNTPSTKKALKGADIGRGARIGANSTILPDIKIGEYALIGAGSVVVNDVPPHSIVYGNPAVQGGWACSCGMPLEVSLSGHLLCSGCGAAYSVSGDTLKRT